MLTIDLLFMSSSFQVLYQRNRCYLGCIFLDVEGREQWQNPCYSSETSALVSNEWVLLIVHWSQPVTWPGVMSLLHGVYASHRESQPGAGTGRGNGEYCKWIMQSSTWDFHITMHTVGTAGIRIPFLPGLPSTSMTNLLQFLLLSIPLALATP